jgi:hypothetical protein
VGRRWRHTLAITAGVLRVHWDQTVIIQLWLIMNIAGSDV